MKKIIESALTVTLTVLVSACGNSSGIANKGTHVANTLIESAQQTINGSWSVNNASLLCDGNPKATSGTAVYSFNSDLDTGTYVLNIPANGMYPPMRKTVNFAIKSFDATSFTIQTVGDIQCVTNGQPCRFGYMSSSITAATPARINFQYALSPSGTSLGLSVNDNTDILTCAIDTTYSSSFLSTRQ
ncbi:MAG: hypothetical protein ABIQ95_04030 [Bdellovibrionia bacterium]